MPKVALLAGSFDPPTLGHIDLIERAATLADTLHVAIAVNSHKERSHLFTPEERLALLKQCLTHVPNIAYSTYLGLTVDHAQEIGANTLVRGLRTEFDVTWEFQMASANKQIGGVETVFLLSTDKYTHISSTLIREIGGGGKDLSPFIPSAILDTVQKELSS